MPISKSAKKSLRVAKRRTKENRIQKNALEKAIKTVTPETLPKTISLIDKAAKTHLIHQNKAARLKSKLTKKIGQPQKLKAQNTKLKTTTKNIKEKPKSTSKKK